MPVNAAGTFYLIGNCSAIPYGKKPSGGCALARKEDVAIATALGASVLQAERFFIGSIFYDGYGIIGDV